MTGSGTSIEFDGAQTWGAGGELAGQFVGFVAVPPDEILISVQNDLLQAISLTGESYGEATITVTIDPLPAQTVTESINEPADLILYYPDGKLHPNPGWLDRTWRNPDSRGRTDTRP